MENRRWSPAVMCGGSHWGRLYLWRTGAALYLSCSGVLTGDVSIYGEQALLSSCDVRGFSLGASLFMENRNCSPAVI